MIERDELKPGSYTYRVNQGMRKILWIMATVRISSFLFVALLSTLITTSGRLGHPSGEIIGAFFAMCALAMWRLLEQASFYYRLDDTLVFDGKTLVVKRGERRVRQYGPISDKPAKIFGDSVHWLPGGERYKSRGPSGKYALDLRFLEEIVITDSISKKDV